MYVNILNYAGRRYLWWTLVLLAVSIGIYYSQDPQLPPNGGSWQGYTLGGLGLAIILWLSWLGVRKRSYKSNAGKLEGWVSAHVYFGLALAVIASLHCAFQFGGNVHTLAYVLMCAVIVSGIYGLYSYLHFPSLLVNNRGNQSFDERVKELDELDKSALETAELCDETVHALIISAIERSAIGGAFLDQLFARDRSRLQLPEQEGSAVVDNPHQQAVIDYLVRKVPDTTKRGEAERLQALLSLFGRRAEIMRRLRRELSLMLRLRLWLCFHIPLTFALLVSLAVHVVAVFFYW